ncbi:hypothetical protein [Hymenobacter koreensis]|uniref:Dephospho-CoA kinase n=1 Tax=Hymenobacter koreensis TaxID=1084523 RepID=A0ABP8JJD5_9BACT
MNKPLQLIGISGKRGAGKSAVADILQYKCGYHHPDVHILNFADPLKAVCATLEDPEAPYEPLLSYYEQEGKAKPSGLLGLTRGELLQSVGQALRDKHPTIWVDVTMKAARALLSGIDDQQLVVVADIRYPNEADAIKAAGGILIRVVGDPMNQRGDGTRDDTHPSETALDDYPGFNVVLYNTGDKAELTELVQKSLAAINERLSRNKRVLFDIGTPSGVHGR